jgi:hypothetical protein
VLAKRVDGAAPAVAVLLDDGDRGPAVTIRSGPAIAAHLTRPTVQREKPKALRVMRQALQDPIDTA